MTDHPALPRDLARGRAPARFARGFAELFRAACFLARHPSLWPWVILPALLSVLILVGAFVGTWAATPVLVSLVWTPRGPHVGWKWLAVLALSAAIAGIVFLALAGLLYLGFGILASPFNDRLSEHVERMVLGPREEPWSFRVMVGDLAQSVAHTILGLVLWAGVMAPVLLLNLIPVVGSVLAFALGLLATGFFLARETMDGPMSRRRLSFADKLRVVAAHLALLEGFGIGAAVLLWIPFLNFVCLPIGVVGGTLLFCGLERQGLLPVSPPAPSRVQ